MLAFVEEGNRVGRLDDLPDFIATALPRVVPCDSISYNEVDPQRQRVVANLYPDDGRFPGDIDLFASLLDQHPVISYCRRTGDGRALRISDFLSDAQFRALDIYKVLYRRLNTQYQMSVTLPAPAPLIIGIALNRTNRDFGETDRVMLNLLRPHLEYLHHRLESQDETRRTLSTLQQAMDATSQGVIVLQASAGVDFANQPARHLLKHYIGEKLRVGGPVPAPIASWLAGQRSGLAGRIDGSAPSEALVIDRGSDRMVCRYLPGVGPHASDMILLEEYQRRVNPDALVTLGLTEREVQVLSMVAAGQTNAQIAERLVISERTVQKHMEHIFKKLRVSTRTAAVALMMDALKRT